MPKTTFRLLAASLLAAGLSVLPAQALDTMRGSLAMATDAPLTLSGDAGDIIFSAVQSARNEPKAKKEAEARDSDPAVRLMARTPSEIQSYFDLYLYVSKAAKGPIAQHMFVYERGFDGTLSLVYDWPVSTGREKKERTKSGRKTFTGTPEGIFKLDPNRFHKTYRSKAWDADMPWTMFFDWIENGHQTGYAIHAAGRSKVKQLGTRASGGCVRLSPENAKLLFNTIRKSYAGLVPVFAMSGDSTSTVGRPARLADGSMELTYGYRVLLHIEDYAGENLPPLSVAAFAPATMSAR